MSPRSAGARPAAGSRAGRDAVRHIVGRDPASLDAHGVARAAIESLAENFSDGVVAPAFWYLLLGLPGLFAYKMANTLDSMIGHRDAALSRLWLGRGAASTISLNLVPARLSGAADRRRGAVRRATADAGARAARSCCATGASTARPMPAGPRAAMAGALGLALAGPRRYAESVVDDPGSATAARAPTPGDIGRALGVYKRRLPGRAAVSSLDAWLAGHRGLFS